MSNRERWVIYPLLFLALGFALKPKFVEPKNLASKTIECDVLKVSQIQSKSPWRAIRALSTIDADVVRVKSLNVVGSRSEPRISMGTQSTLTDGKAKTVKSGILELYGKNNKPILVLGSTDNGNSGFAVAKNTAGQDQVILLASPTGGQLRLNDSNGQVQVFAGHLPLISGVYVRQLDTPASRAYWLGPLDRSKLPKPKKTEPKKTKAKGPTIKKRPSKKLAPKKLKTNAKKTGPSNP